MRIRINALDTLFFRDGKPFSMGEESWADGVFPPYPTVLYGAMRTWYISNHKMGVSQNTIDESGDMMIKGIHYRMSDGLYLPLPLDLVEPKGKSNTEKNNENRKKEYRVIKLTCKKAQSLNNYPLPYFLMTENPQEEVETLGGGFINNTVFKQYLEGSLYEAQARVLKDSAPTEPKVGIGRNDTTLTAEEGRLYRVGMLRASDFEIIVELSLPVEEPHSQPTFLKLGGEGKIASFIDRGSMDDLKIEKDSISLKEGEFKLYLSTPAVFHKGWQPDLHKFGIEADLIAAAVGKPLNLGGFDMALREAKPMYKAVPAGSVYYYHTKEPAKKIIEKLQGCSISDKMPEQGLGIAFVGNF